MSHIETINVAGRPRTYDRDKIAQELIEWSELETSINLNAFCGKVKIAPSNILRWVKECDTFRQAYEYARSNLGARREQLLSENKLHVKAYDLNSKVYDAFLKAESREEKEFESKLNAQDQSGVLDQQKKAIESLINGIADNK